MKDVVLKNKDQPFSNYRRVQPWRFFMVKIFWLNNNPVRTLMIQRISVEKNLFRDVVR